MGIQILINQNFSLMKLNLFFSIFTLLFISGFTQAQEYNERVLTSGNESFSEMRYMAMNGINRSYQIGSVAGRAAVRCIDQQGDLVWTNLLGPANSRYTKIEMQGATMLLLGSIGNVGDGRTPDLMVTKINSNGIIIYNTRLRTSLIPTATRIAAEQITKESNGHCWVGFRMDDSSPGDGQSDEIRLIELDGSGQFVQGTSAGLFEDSDLRGLVFDNITNELVMYWTTPSNNNHYIGKIDVINPLVQQNVTITAPTGAGVYTNMEKRQDNALSSVIYLSGGNSITQFNNSDDSSLGQRNFSTTTPISDLHVTPHFVSGYCDGSDQFFTHTANNTVWQYNSTNANGYQFDDRSPASNANGTITGAWSGSNYNLVMLSDEANGAETYQGHIATMENSCRIDIDNITSSFQTVTVANNTSSLLLSQTLTTASITANDERFNLTEHICVPPVPNIQYCSINCGGVCAVLLTPQGSVAQPGATYLWTVTGGGTTWTSTDLNAVFFPTQNVQYTACLTITDIDGTATVCEPLQVNCIVAAGQNVIEDVEESDTKKIEELDSREKVSEGYRVYPNPTSEMITVEYAGQGSADITCELYDANGQKLIGHTTRNNQGISTMTNLDYPAGIYFLRITNNESNQMDIERIVLTK